MNGCKVAEVGSGEIMIAACSNLLLRSPNFGNEMVIIGFGVTNALEK